MKFNESFLRNLFQLLFGPYKKLKTEAFGDLVKRHLRIKGANKRIAYIRFKNFLLIEQNPLKPSKFGKRARAGERIAWLIDLDTNRYILRIENDKIISNIKNYA